MANRSEASPGRDRKRKAHSKSRHGCAQCKRRHYKCDEVHPTCGGCRRQNLTCSLGGHDTEGDDAQSLPARDLAMDDLRLLYQWLRGDAAFFSDQDQTESIRSKDREMELAFAHPYLMHAILAIAALDLFHQDTTQHRYYLLASSHHIAASRIARPNIQRIESDHSAALYLFSAYTSLFALAEPPFRYETDSSRGQQDLVGDLIVAFKAARGINAVHQSNEARLTADNLPDKSNWSGNSNCYASTVHKDWPNLTDLEAMIHRTYEPSNALPTCDAFKNLFQRLSLLRNSAKDSSTAHTIMTWHMHLDDTVTELVYTRHPLGLLLLGYFAVLIHMRANIWFFQRWPKALLFAVARELESVNHEWSAWLQWPQAMLDDEIPKTPGKAT